LELPPPNVAEGGLRSPLSPPPKPPKETKPDDGCKLPKLPNPAVDVPPKGDVVGIFPNADVEDAAPNPLLVVVEANPLELVVPPNPVEVEPTAPNGDFSELAKADKPEDLKALGSAGLLTEERVDCLGEAKLPNGDAVDALANPLGGVDVRDGSSNAVDVVCSSSLCLFLSGSFSFCELLGGCDSDASRVELSSLSD
jgi:hypothetical protein